MQSLSRSHCLSGGNTAVAEAISRAGALLIPIPWPDKRVGGLANVSTASPLRQLPPAADMPSQMLTAAMCHLQTHAPQQRSSLFEHLVCAHEERFGDGQAKGLGGLEVDHQLELDWGLDWKLARICALENTIGIGRRAPKIIG
jgi:hypothetical protein